MCLDLCPRLTHAPAPPNVVKNHQTRWGNMRSYLVKVVNSRQTIMMPINKDEIERPMISEAA